MIGPPWVPIDAYLAREAATTRALLAEIMRAMLDPASYHLPPGFIRSCRRGIWV